MTFHSIRIKRLIDEFRQPSDKRDISPWSLSFLRMVWVDKSNSVLLASHPQSGLNWFSDLLNFCLYRCHNQDYPFSVLEGTGPFRARINKPFRLFWPADSRCRNADKLRSSLPGETIDYCFHTHQFWQDTPLWGMDRARTFLIIRNIPSTLFSGFRMKSQIKPYRDFDHYLDDGALNRIIGFYNSWWAFRESGRSFYSVKYEEMRKSPVDTLIKLFEDMFRHELKRSIAEESVEFFSFERMEQLEADSTADEGKRFYHKGKLDYSDAIPPESMRRILDAIESELEYDFGYDYQ